MNMCYSRKKIGARATVVATVLTMALTFPVFAAGTSLDDVVAANGTTQTVTETTAAPGNESSGQNKSGGEVDIVIDKTGSGAVSDLSNSVNFGTADETVRNLQKSAGKPLGIAIQLLAYALTIGLTFRTLLDLCYIAIPFSQNWLSGGQQGVAQGQQQGGMGGMGGMGSMGGMGGFGGGFGGGMGGFGGGMGGMSGMGGMGGQQQQAMGHCIVSQEALNAVAGSKVAGPNGKSQSALKTYFKSMTEYCILTPIMVVLSLTGVISQLGFMLGNILTNAISSFF